MTTCLLGLITTGLTTLGGLLTNKLNANNAILTSVNKTANTIITIVIASIYLLAYKYFLHCCIHTQNMQLSGDDYRDLFAIKCTQLEMVQDRGFNIGAEEYLLGRDITCLDFVRYYQGIQRADFRSALCAVYAHRETPDRRLYVHYNQLPDRPQHKPKQYSKAELSGVIEDVELHAATDIILILNTKMSSAAAAALSLLTGKLVHVFHDDQLRYNVMRHILVPHHVLVTEDEKASILRNNRATAAQFPCICVDDPVAAYMGARIGDMIKIYRRNIFTAAVVDREVAYRVVVARSINDK